MVLTGTKLVICFGDCKLSNKKLADDKESIIPPERANKVKFKLRKNARTITGDGFSDNQFENPSTKIPYKAIFIALGLFVAGSLLIIFGSLLFTGIIYMQNSSHTWPLLLVGALMFIPGVYYLRIACYAYKGYDGFSFDNIPELE